MLNVKVHDVNWTEGSIFLKGIKGSRDRDIPLQPWLHEKLTVYAANNQLIHPSTPLFPIAYNTLGQLWRIYRPTPHKTLRSLRHTFAVRMYKKSKDARIVQKMLGHKWLSTTEIYLDFEYGREEFRKWILG